MNFNGGVSANTPASQLPVAVLSTFCLSLPIIASELISCVQTIVFISVFNEYSIPSFTFSGIFSGLATIFISFYSDSRSLLRPRFILLGGEFLFTIGLILLLIVDDKFRHDRFNATDSLRVPYGYLITGFVFTQLSINLFQVCGRSLLVKHLPAEAQTYAHSWAATFMLIGSFLVNLIFGVTIRRDSPEMSQDIVKAVSIAFAAVALLLVTLAIVQIPDPAYAPDGAIATLFVTDSFPNFFKLSLPYVVGQLGFLIVTFITPVLASEYAEDFDPTLNPVDGIGYSFVGLACASIVGIGAAWLTRSSLGTRGTLVLSLLIAATFTALLLFVGTPETMTIPVVQAVFAGAAPGALASAGWATIAADVPRESIGKYLGIVIGLTGMLRGFGLFVIALGSNVLAPSLFAVAACFAWVLPGATQPAAQLA